MEFCINLNRNEQLFNAVHEFAVNCDYDTNLAEKVQSMVITLFEMYEKTKGELQKIFSIAEAKLVVSALLFNTEIEANGYSWNIYSAIVNICEDKGADIAFDVNMEVLLNKIDKLTEFQAFTLMTMVNEIQREVIQLSLDDLNEYIQKLFKPV